MKWQLVVILGIIALLIGMPLIGAALLVGATIMTGPSLHPKRSLDEPEETESQWRTFEASLDSVRGDKSAQDVVRILGSQRMLKRFLERHVFRDRFYISKYEVKEKIKTAGEYNDPVIVNVTARWLKEIFGKTMIIWLSAQDDKKTYNIETLYLPTYLPTMDSDVEALDSDVLEKFKNALLTGQKPSNYDNYLIFLRDPKFGGGHFQRVEWYNTKPHTHSGYRNVPSANAQLGMQKLYYKEEGGDGDCFYHVIRSFVGETFFTDHQQVRNAIGDYIDTFDEDRFIELFLKTQFVMAKDTLAFERISEFVNFFNSLPVTKSRIRRRVDDVEEVEEMVSHRRKVEPTFLAAQYLLGYFAQMWGIVITAYPRLATVDNFDRVVIMKIIARERKLKDKPNEYIYKVGDQTREYGYKTIDGRGMEITMELDRRPFTLKLNAKTVRELLRTYQQYY